MEILHNHGRVVGFRADRVFHDIDGRPHHHTQYVLPRWLYWLSEKLARCPGGEEHKLRHRIEHDAYRQRQGKMPYGWEDP